ncbi:MAG: hypothetical protein K9N34_06155 [Candidatus Marinimicrobia bacterium]|nr:hypothetical protein [Candidatus Neomarinimicrobiota bacterium]MCF7840162.1 hypothetical protein [Candidatus Neomarinimicrobiota bacterium]
MHNWEGRKSLRNAAPLVAVLFFFATCSTPTGLEPVAGVEGTLTFQGTWPDSIKGAALVALSSFPADVSQAANLLVNYSTPAPSGTDSIEHFIQLLPGTYYLLTLGLTIEPAVFATKLDSFQTSGNLPVVLLDTDLATISQPVTILPQTIHPLDRTVWF